MDGLLLPDERAEPLEDGVDMACVGSEVEDGVEIDAAAEHPVGPDELAEVLLLVPGSKRVALDEPVGLVPGEPGFDECEQQALAAQEAVARIEIALHPLGADRPACAQPAG